MQRQSHESDRDTSFRSEWRDADDHATKTGADEGHITMASTAAPNYDRNYDVKNVEADPAALKLSCQVDAWRSANIDLSAQRSNGGHARVATAIVSHAVL
jgi:hypothetical protein